MPTEFFFPTPIYFSVLDGVELDTIQSEIEKEISVIDWENLNTPWDDNMRATFQYNVVNNIINHLPCFKKLIIENVIKFGKSCGQDFKSVDITESWINFSKKGSYQNYHTHGTADISGAYYFKTIQTDGDIKFRTPCIAHEISKLIPQQLTSIGHMPVVGKLVLFPSFLSHAVLLNNTDNERISISFNINVKRDFDL